MIPIVRSSKMSGKLDGISAFNTDTTSNSFCQQEYNKAKSKSICKKCYSMNMLNTFRKNCVPSFKRNSEILASDGPITVPPINAAYVRFHGHGELINDNHFLNFCDIARAHPNTTFALWTKRIGIVRRNLDAVPDNMILIYSNPSIDNVMQEPPRNFHRVFNNVSESYTGETNCTGQKCMDCLLCYKFDTTKVIIEHIK